MTADFERARAVADAVLLEGYVLYPYRATAPKNQFRWAFGVLAPRAWAEAGGCERWWFETQCVVEGTARFEGRLRFLHARRRTVETPRGEPVASLEVDGRLLLPWEEGQVREVDFAGDLGFDIPGGSDVEEVRDATGALAARVVRRQEALRGAIGVRTERLSGDLHRLTIRVENQTPWSDLQAPRELALGGGLLTAHLLLRSEGGAFVSLLDPPPHGEAAAAGCRQTGLYPVLAGPSGDRDLVLASPIILYDHPRVAPESAADFCDATEIDELLTLRTANLTDEEKRQARATDPRSAALVDRVEQMPPGLMERLHGAVRELEGGEMVPRARPVSDAEAAAAAGVAPGSRVRLRASQRRTDAQDLLYVGEIATVEAVLWDVDGSPHIAVTIDADPAAELHRWYGRFHYYRPDEVEPL